DEPHARPKRRAAHAGNGEREVEPAEGCERDHAGDRDRFRPREQRGQRVRRMVGRLCHAACVHSVRPPARASRYAADRTTALTADKREFEAIVVGGGPAGLTAAVALAASGVTTALAGKPPARSDNRTTALLASSVTALETLGVWPLCREQSAPLRHLRIVDDTGRLWRAPEVKF